MGRTVLTIAGLLGFLCGVFVYPFLDIMASLFWGVVIGLYLVLFFFLKSPIIRTIIVFNILFLAGLWRADLGQHVASPEEVDFYTGQRVTMEGVVIDPDIRRDKAKYTLHVRRLAFGVGRPPQAVTGKLLITLPKYPQYRYGDVLQVSGELEAPGQIEDFAYDDYLSRFGIYSVMYRPRVYRLSEGQGSRFWHAMHWLRTGFMERISRTFPEPHASFEAGLLVGARKGIPPTLMEQFNITGLTHIIAISGYNITIIIVFVMWLLRWLPRMAAFYAATFAIVLFTLFVGASPAVVRASIMGILGLIALNTGRQSNIHLMILFAAALMILWNPGILWFDVGFQLSFLAVLGLIYIAPLFEAYAEKLPRTLGIREAILMTLSAQVTALPIIVYNFERLSLIAPLANLLVVFAVPLAMLLGFLAILLSFALPGLGLAIGYLAWGVLSYIIKVIELLSAVPYASINLPGMKGWMVAAYYTGLILFLLGYRFFVTKAVI